MSSQPQNLQRFHTGLEHSRPSQRLFSDGLTILHDPPDSLADVVLINDLKEWGWTINDSKELWPKKLLPDEAPGYRILAFGYSPKPDPTSLAEIVSHDDVKDYARNLIKALVDQRLEDKGKAVDQPAPRPIVFIAHGLGGVVCEQALVMSNQDELEKDDRRIINLTRTIILLGTPHYRAGIAEWSLIYAGSMEIKAEGGQQQAFSSIKESLKSLAEMQIKFRDNIMGDPRKRRLEPLKVVCIFTRSSIPRNNPMLSPEWAILPGSRVISCQADHFGMTNFTGKEDPNFKLIVGYLKILSSALRTKGYQPPGPIVTDRSNQPHQPNEAERTGEADETDQPVEADRPSWPGKRKDYMAVQKRICQPGEVIALGNIIHSLEDVHNPLVTSKEILATLSSQVQEVFFEKTPFNFTEEMIESSEFDMYIEFLKSVYGELRNKTKREILEGHKYEMVTSTWDPDIEYIRAALARSATQDHLELAARKGTLYIVTGIEYIVGAPVQVDIESSREGAFREYLFSYRVREIQIRRRRVSPRVYSSAEVV